MANREMTLSEIQDVSLSVLEEFSSFCESEGLRYSLAYGTLIGAVRHKGFIPWDDDIDVLMPRPDYERLLSLYKDGNGFTLLWPGKDGCSLQYARLCDVSRTRVRSKSPWHDGESGVWIDIFPIDAAPDDLAAAKKKYLKCHVMYRDLLARRRTLRYRDSRGVFSKIKYAFYRLCGRIHATEAAVRLDQFCKEIPYGSTSRVIDFAAPLYKKVFYYTPSDLEDYVRVDFCGKRFFAMKHYDTCLRVQYGDYLKLPPQSQRVPGHSFQNYLWL